MYNNIRNRYMSGPLIAILALFAVTACSTTNLAKKEHDFTIERVDSKGASINHVYLTYSGNKLTLRGEVKRSLTGRGPIPGHLHISLINSQGDIIKETDIGYKRRNIRSSIATFNTQLPVGLASGSTIKVTHYDSETHKIFPEETLWRDSE